MKIFNQYFRFDHEIEFRSLSDLSQIVQSYSTGTLQPTDICAAFPSTLLFVHKSKGPPDVYWLDCNGTEPKLTGKKIRTGLKCTMDICHIPDKQKSLLVVTDYLFSSVHA